MNQMIPANKNTPLSPFVAAFILLRVVLILIIWLGLFLTMYVGFFTIPVIVISIITIIYAIMDVVLYVRVRQYERFAKERKEFLKGVNDQGSTEKSSDEK